MPEDVQVLLAEGIAELSIELDVATQTKLLEFVHLLAKWNQAYNLTAVRQPDQMVIRHLLDSLVIAPYLRGVSVLDVGTGPGLPGIPLALACPALHFTLLDSNGKKIRFVTQALAELGLENADVVQSRVEDYRPAEHFDTIIARAYASIAEMLNQSQHLLAEQGQFLIMKGAYPLAEVDAMPAGFKISAVHQLKVPMLDAERHLLIIEAD